MTKAMIKADETMTKAKPKTKAEIGDCPFCGRAPIAKTETREGVKGSLEKCGSCDRWHLNKNGAK